PLFREGEKRLAATVLGAESRAPFVASARATTGVVIRADLVEGCGFTDLPLLWHAVRIRRAAPSPFSLAAYIILPIERHTSFPLYVSIYNGPRNICSSRSAQGNETEQRGWIRERCARVGWAGVWCRCSGAGEPFVTAAPPRN
ncbi:uncharacterized protein LOC118647282, partial [Monomorium pharaonis]|uniref:uncharacterized protein LOC118647282 n=1 Tax=Monomorium pharaonis TaxID=307658 RepID=UPI00174620EC